VCELSDVEASSSSGKSLNFASIGHGAGYVEGHITCRGSPSGLGGRAGHRGRKSGEAKREAHLNNRSARLGRKTPSTHPPLQAPVYEIANERMVMGVCAGASCAILLAYLPSIWRKLAIGHRTAVAKFLATGGRPNKVYRGE
jgi:hypothetical protein